MAIRGAPSIDRDAVLDVATEVLATYGVRRVSLRDLAQEAGVSRQSLYRWFGDRDGVVRAVVVRERDRFVAAALTAADSHDDLRDAVPALIAEVLRMAASHPLLNRLRTSDPEVLLLLLASADNVVIETVRAAAVEFLDRRVPGTDPGQLADGADVFARLVVSYIVQPPTAPPERMAAVAGAVVLSLLDPREESVP